MLTAHLFPELDDDAARGALIARFGDQPQAVFAPLMNHNHIRVSDQIMSTPLPSDALPSLEGQREGTFHPLLLPIAAPHIHRVAQAVQQAGLDRALTRSSAQAILSALVQTSLRTLVGVLQDMAADGELVGDTPEQRFNDFEAQLATQSVQERLNEDYPLLLPTCHQVAERTADNVVQLLHDLVADSDLLRRHGLLGAKVTGMDVDAGDTHAGGRSVAILDLADGTRLVHKPRSLAIDVAYNQFITRVNALAGTRLATVNTLDCGDHGWSGFITTDLPADRAEEDHYFEQVGQLLAVAHLLGAADLHQENLVCHRAGPVLVDLETVMHPRLATEGPEGPTVMDDLEEGVSATGLLPYVVVHGDHAADVGAVGSSEGVLSPYKSLVVRRAGRDDMEAVLEHVPMPAGHPTPTVPSDHERAVEVCQLIQQGFETVYSALIEHREVLAAQVLDDFRDARVRLIVNQTATYAQLLRMATHPLLFRDSRLRLAGLQRIGLWGGDAHRGINQAELRDLAEGDIPSFQVDCSSTAVLDSRGVPTGDHVRTAPATAAARRISEMSAEGLKRQQWRISDVLVGRFPVAYERTIAHPDVATNSQNSATSQTSIGDAATAAARDLVVQIADDLLERQCAGLTPGSPATWVGPRLDHEVSGWLPDVLVNDLYAGTLGPAMFLAHAAQITDDPRYAHAAERVFEPLAELLDSNALIEQSRRTQRIGVYSGLAGSHLALAVAAQALDQPQWRSQVDANLDALAGEVTDTHTLDHLDGAAGILSLSTMLAGNATGQGRAAAARLATTCHARLHEAISDATAGELLRYGGFAHGIAGAHTALSRAASVFALSDVGVGEQLLDRLNSFYDPQLGIYHATRDAAGAPVGWCHGIVGIGFAHTVRQRYGLAPAPTAERDLRRAAELILAHGLGSSPGYCHGDVGNVEILTAIAGCLNDTHLARTATRLSSHLVRDVLPQAVNDQYNRNAHSPGLMVGTTGPGWFALRLLAPDRVPDLLSLDWAPHQHPTPNASHHPIRSTTCLRPPTPTVSTCQIHST